MSKAFHYNSCRQTCQRERRTCAPHKPPPPVPDCSSYCCFHCCWREKVSKAAWRHFAPLRPTFRGGFFLHPLSSQRVAVSHTSAGCRCKVLNAETTMQRKRGSGSDEPKYRKSREVLYSSCRRIPCTFNTDADAITNCTLQR